ncbi:MAG: hypothetical protein KF901_26655 [Myxococcales bacterium]|nr:hypothetical protein [Myxococcales bacterium]
MAKWRTGDAPDALLFFLFGDIVEGMAATAEDLRAVFAAGAQRLAKLRIVPPPERWHELRILADALSGTTDLDVALDDLVETKAFARALVELGENGVPTGRELGLDHSPAHLPAPNVVQLVDTLRMQQEVVAVLRGGITSGEHLNDLDADYLATWPPELAEARYLYERGTTAGLGVIAYLVGLPLDPERLGVLLDAWREGLNAMVAFGMGLGILPRERFEHIAPIDVDRAILEHAARAEHLRKAAKQMREQGIVDVALDADD